MLSVRRRVLGGVVGAGALASSALAGGPPAMDPVTFPIDPESVGTAIATAGGAILLIVFAVGIGFMLVKKLKKRLTSSV